MNRILSAGLIIALCGTVASAQPILDGVRDASYILRSVQTVETQFGDANPNLGSELDAAWVDTDGSTLYLLLTGNLENNFNKLNIFIDSVAGGQNQLENDANNGGTNPENDGWASKHAGFTFDTGFAADYMLILRNGNFGGDRFDVDFATIGGGLGAFENGSDVFGGSLTGSNASALPNGIGVAFDRTNTAGVMACDTPGGSGCEAADQTAAAAVTTGIELAIPLAAIGNPASPNQVKFSAMVNGSNHDFLSNQFLGGLPAGQGNLGGDGMGGFNGTVGNINLNNFRGNQFFGVPEPGALVLALVALAGVGALRRR